MKKLTRYLYFIIYILSTVLTIGAFIFANLTAIAPTNNGGGNGNIGLFPFFFYFHLLLFSSVCLSVICMNLCIATCRRGLFE